MNKVFCKKRLFFSLIFTGYLILFNTSCGLDTFYELNSPSAIYHQPSWEIETEAENYFSFETPSNNNTNIKYLGTEVYYKIYKNSSTMISHVSELVTLSNKADSASSAASRLIESYKYQPLRGLGYDNKAVLIPTSATRYDDNDQDIYYDKNVKVEIRLSDYQGIYFAKIMADDNNIYSSNKDNSSVVVPTRYLPTKPTFTITNTNLPQNDDVDVSGSTSSSDTSLYVSMFAIAVGQDITYTRVYSNILYLGSVRLAIQ